MADKIKFLMDEHVDEAVTRGLQMRGVDVFTVQEAGLAHTPDLVILVYALEHERVIFTQDQDFLAAHESGKPHAGLAYANRQIAIGAIVRGLMLIYDVLTPDEMRGHLEYL